MKRSRERSRAWQPAVAHWRARVLFFLLMGFFGVLLARAVWLQGFSVVFLQKQGEERFSRRIEQVASRGTIRDRNGIPLAVSTSADSIWVRPEELAINHQQKVALSRLLQMPLTELDKKLNQDDRSFVYLKRQIDPGVALQIMKLKISGVYDQTGFHRIYPWGSEMAHLVGFTSVEDQGQEGMELSYENLLRGVGGVTRVVKNRRGAVIETMGDVRAYQAGRDLTLSVDARLQHLVSRALRQTVLEHRAKAGAVVVLDAHTGEVVAMCNYPDFDPNDRGHLTGEDLRNRALTDIYEPGSIIKPLVIGEALQNHLITPETVIDTQNGSFEIAHHIIRDSHPAPLMTVREVIQHSSNIGAAKIGLMMSPHMEWNVLTDVGFGQVPHLGFPGESPGRLRPYANWKPIEQATISFGNGVAVSLIQMAHAYTVFTNQGKLLPLSLLLNHEHSLVNRQVFDPSVVQEVTSMMEKVVSPEGTAPLAQVHGYRVAGKTGTAHKVVGGHYVNQYVASFVGFAPVSNPQYIMAVMIDEPQGQDYYGGQVAAPLFSKIMGDILEVQQIPFDDPNISVGSHPNEGILTQETQKAPT
ncbi:MAG: penicillin-binding protein 2 [Ferrovum sp.]|nr:penicillin-binding protein 2 [Ferrovum sp.]